MLEVQVRDPSSLNLTRMRRLNTWMLRRNRSTHLLLPAAGLDVPSEVVAALAHEWNESRLLGEVRSTPLVQDPESRWISGGTNTDGEST